MESSSELVPSWLLLAVPLAVALWKWRAILKFLLVVYRRLMPPKRYELEFEFNHAADAEFQKYQAQDGSYKGRTFVHFFTVIVMTNDFAVSIRKIWVKSQDGRRFDAWKLGEMFHEPDENARIEAQAIRRFHIMAMSDDKPGPLATVHIQHNGQERIVKLTSAYTRLKLAVSRWFDRQ